MCGVTGYLRRTPTADPSVLVALLAGIRDRGPDDEGAAFILPAPPRILPLTTTGSRATIRERAPELASTPTPHIAALAHSRYAIIDLSDAAHQPFVSSDGTIAGAFNGEIYNHVELRRELEDRGVRFRTASDTEVLVEGFRLWAEQLWPRLSGFWAAALYDTRDRALTISRDRMGVAPLYYRETEAGLFFSSRIQPLLDVMPATRAHDDSALRGFVVAGMKDFGPDTCFRDVKSFAPASVYRFAEGRCAIAEASIRQFWQLPATRWRLGDLSLDEAAHGVRERLVRAVELRLRSDVPVAFELSGGLDSSSVVAAAAELGGAHTSYTVSVPERDEWPYAREVAARFGITPLVLTAGEDGLIDDAARFARVMEEPYHSPNVFTSYDMRRQIKADGFAVVISGSGGDELLGGYEYEFWDAAFAALWREGHGGKALRHAFGHYAGSAHRRRHTAREIIGALKRLVSGSASDRGAPSGARSPAEQLRLSYASRSFDDRIRYHFEVAQLPYYLRNGDHLTMSIPLEHRFPFLDTALVEYCAQLPVAYLYRDGYTKYVLRHAFRDVLPPQVTWRREKMGFPFPFARFLARHKTILAPYATRAAAAVPVFSGALRYDDLMTEDPLLLWRLCSTGLWLQHAQ